ncbi:aminopeptidase N [Streptomyces cinnamoneus]|uniref:aminopeptidase N n=1 Tax=Streptomyces cinnamoneus TaxID=53446 RepID=UPI000CEECC04|nr:aminopeptidase N [Streptomyces cinnamoneus]PPT16409.1 aminopeptidase N [Streptomyces cinnamoneus]
MPVLTCDEAQTRARLLDVHRYEIDLDLTRGDEHFRSTTVIHFTARNSGDTFVELKPATLHTVRLDGTPLDPATLDDNRLPLTLTAGPHELHVEADMRYSRTGEGMHRFTDPADGETYLYTQTFIDDAQRVFAAFDQPDLKAVYDATVTAPPHWTVLGNARATRVGPPAQGRWHLATTKPLSTYFVAFAAGPWHSVHTEHAGLPFALHCRRSLAPHLDADAGELLDITRRCFDRYHEIFDEPYPFDSYDQAFVPEFNAGAMENPGLVTFRDEFVYRSAVTDTERQTRGMVIAHEMAHMWFGDLVTLRWWDDIWLNESFAEYMGYQVLADATRFTGTWTDFAIARKSWGYDADQRPSTHPVAPAPGAVTDTASALLNFDGISYAKGASALRQLVTWLGEKDFLAGINDHFSRHRFGNATLADFIDSLDRHSSRDVPTWAAHWLRTSGVDTLTPHTPAPTTPGTWRLELHHDGTRPHHLTVGLYDHTPDDPHALTPRTPLTLDLPADGHTPVLDLPGPRPALVLLNDGDLTYAKVRLDPDSWTTALTSLSSLPDPLTRAVLWNAARDMVRDAELAPAAYLDAARAHLPHENDIAITQGVLAFARTAIADHYTTAKDRPAALATLTDLCHDLLTRTEGTDAHGLRLTAVRTLISSATTPTTLQDWLAAGTVPAGPALDPELRWGILARLAVLGATTTADIDAELTRDPSATGQEGAARCRAALPDPVTKEAAWHAMYGGDDLSNYLFTATAQGFWQPEQTDLLRPYLDRYYPDAVAVAARRGPALAVAAGRDGFPRTLIDEENLRRGEQCLRDADPTPALRRRLTDQLDDLRRALAIHAAQG